MAHSPHSALLGSICATIHRFGRAPRLALASVTIAVAVPVFAAPFEDAANTTYPPPPFLPPAGHPRVYFTARDIPRLRENVTKPQDAAAWAAHLAAIKQGTDSVLPPPTDPQRGNPSTPVLTLIESLAFDYALRGDVAHGRQAVAALHNYLRTVVYPPHDYNNTGETVYLIGAVYDWCHPLLTPAERTTFIAQGLHIASLMEIGWPPVKQANVTGHGPEGQLQRDLMCFALATYDERPDIYRVVAGRFFDRFLAPKRFMYPAHMHTQGNHYTSYRGQWELLAAWIFDRLGRPAVFGPDQAHLLDWMLYARRPDGQVLRDGDTHINNEPVGSYFRGPARPFFLAANLYHNPYYKEEALRELPRFAPMPRPNNQALTSTEILLFNDPDLAPRPLSELPLTAYFPSPKGAMIARTGWQDGLGSPAVVAEFKINEWYFANHQHLDAGAFQLYYRGALAIDSGYYQAAINRHDDAANDGNTGYGGLYDINYNKRTIAHNTILVRDPDEKFESVRWRHYPVGNDGGQRFPNLWREPGEQAELENPANGYRIGTVLGHDFGPDAQAPDYTYLKGDLTHAYSRKIQAFERSFAFLDLKNAAHPAALIVFDRVVSANPTFQKAWVLHGLEAPDIHGQRVVFKDTRPGYTGKLTCDTLLPHADDTQIATFGGPGREAWVDGVNYVARLRPHAINEGGGWRVEVSPKTPRATDYFLHVLQVGDHTPDTPPLTPTLIETADRVGVVLADRVVLFGRTRDRTHDPVPFAFAGAGTFELLIADLAAGTWQIEHPGAPTRMVTVMPEAGTACFIGPAGEYQLTPLKAAP